MVHTAALFYLQSTSFSTDSSCHDIGPPVWRYPGQCEGVSLDGRLGINLHPCRARDGSGVGEGHQTGGDVPLGLLEAWVRTVKRYSWLLFS